MSKRTSDYTRQYAPYSPGNGLDIPQLSSEASSPLTQFERHPDTDHFGLLYETREEQFATVIPYIREGLEDNERCMYIVDDNSRDEVITALREGGVAVDAALASGQLSFHTVEETYLEGGEFDVEAARALLQTAMEEALTEFEGFRVTAEETWLVDDKATQEAFMTCEAHVNDLLDSEAGMALCQYNRTELSPEVIDDVLKTHPYLIYDDTVCENFYYEPPAEYFGPDQPSREIDRKLATLVDRTNARATIEIRERYQQELYETIADPQTSFGDKIENLLELGCQRLGLEIGYFTKTLDNYTFEIVEAVGEHESIKPGVTDSLCDTYCEKLLASPDPISVRDAAEVGWTDDPAYERFGLDAYFATTVHVGGEEYGTLCFASETPRKEPYTDAERTFLDLMGQWVEYELERQRHERFLRSCYQITADPDLGFDEKLERLLELGCDRFGLEMGGLNHLPSWVGEFRLEQGVGLGIDPDEELWTDPDNDCYCRRSITEDEPVAMPDVRGTDWTEDTIYQEFGMTSYLGTRVTSGSTPYGTLWFGSTEPRDEPFTVAERSFIELMGQWVSYEIERREYNESQRELYEITADPGLSTEEKIDRLLEMGCDRLDLPVGMLTCERTEAFEIEHMHGTHPDLDEGTLTPPLTDNYCRRVVETGDSINVADAGAAGWDGDALYDEFDLQSYAGTQVTVDGDAYGTIFFTDTAPREEFSEAEERFLDILGQCIGYEFERQQYEQELEETIDRLQQSNERLEQFAYAASHDLQEPLRMVTTYLQMIEQRYSDAFDEDGEEFLEFAVNGSERMRAMIDALLQYSRIDRCGDPLEPVELDNVLDDVLSDLQIEIDETNAEITAEQLPCVEGDASQLRQVFQNLLDNAITYSGDDPPQIHLDAERQGREWVISVHDDGIGISPDEQDRIFTIFDRLHSRNEYEGTGIGLALCQRIVERHDGEIWVESEPGEGSSFTFTLSASEE